MPRGLAPSGLLAALALVAALGPGEARAWTDAAVRSVGARVVIAPDATAHVALTATVRVHGGWLEGLELAGLDPDLALDEAAPPYAIDEAGQRYQPRAEVLEGGRVQLAFTQRSPRRGRLSVHIAYRTRLAHRATEPLEEDGRVRVSWTLPAWRSGLDGVSIELIAPSGSRLGPRGEGDSGASVETETEELAEGTRLRWRRAHLPRTVSWTVATDVPAGAMIEELRGAPRVRATPPPAQPALAPLDPAPYWLGLALALALLACAKIASVERLARERRSRARPLLFAPAWLRAIVSAGACVAGAALGPGSPRVGLALFALAMLSATYLRGAPQPPSRLGAWRPADARWIRAARRSWLRALAPSAWLDATTPVGLLHLALWLSLPWLLPLPLEVRIATSVLPLPLLSTGTRASFPVGPMDSLRALLAIARRMRALPEGVGLAPVVHVDVRGEVQEARVRTVLAHRPRGLLRLDLALAVAEHAGGHVHEPMLLVVTRASSAAEAALAAALPDVDPVTSPGGRRVLRLMPLGDPAHAIKERSGVTPGRHPPLSAGVGMPTRSGATHAIARVVAAFGECPEAPLAVRGTATEQETVHELPAPRAVGF